MGDVIEIKHGYAFDGTYFRDEPPGDILLTPGNFEIGGGFKADKFKYYDGPVPEEFALTEGDLLVTMTDLSKAADTLGYPAIVPKLKGRRYLHNQRLGKVLILANAPIHGMFLYFLLRTREYRDEVLASATGTTVKHTSPSRIKEFSFLRPPIEEQRAIAEVLATLDDKIELNRRTNETLEAMARAIFKSWFVDFDPVRAKAEGRQPFGMDAATAALFPDSFQDSPLGKIPKGWRVAAIGEDFNLTMGQSPPGETYNEDGDGLAFFQGKTDFGFRYPSKRMYCTAPTRLADAGDTLVSVRAPVGAINMANEKCCIGRGVAALRHKNGSRSYTYYAAHAQKEAFEQFEAEGTVFGSLGRKDFEAILSVSPPTSLAERFEQMAFPFDQRVENNEHESRTLAALRDALLPKLISGEIRLKQAEKPSETKA